MIREHEIEHSKKLLKELVQLQSRAFTALEAFRLIHKDRTVHYEKLVYWVGMTIQATQREFYSQLQYLKEENND